MNLDKEKLFSLYHKLRTEEHIPLVPFLRMPEMRFVHIPGNNIKEIANRFYKEYTKWRKLRLLPEVIVSVEEYIGWLCKRYAKDPQPLIQYWAENQNNIKAITPLTSAVAIFFMFYPDIDKSELCNLTGVGITNLDNHSRRIKIEGTSVPSQSYKI